VVLLLLFGRRRTFSDEPAAVEVCEDLAGELVGDVRDVLEGVFVGRDAEGIVVGKRALGEVEAHGAGVEQHYAGVVCSRWVDDDGGQGVLQQRVDAVVGEERHAGFAPGFRGAAVLLCQVQFFARIVDFLGDAVAFAGSEACLGVRFVGFPLAAGGVVLEGHAVPVEVAAGVDRAGGL
jgi:hypothetical protein